MKITTLLIGIGLLVPSACHAPRDWLCGTALLEQSMIMQKAQQSPYVFDDSSDATLLLVVNVEIPGVFETREAAFHLRKKRDGEQVGLSRRAILVGQNQAAEPDVPSYVDVTIRGEDLLLAAAVHWRKRDTELSGSDALEFPIGFLAPFSIRERGLAVKGSWQTIQKPNKALAPTPMSVMSPAAQEPRQP